MSIYCIKYEKSARASNYEDQLEILKNAKGSSEVGQLIFDGKIDICYNELLADLIERNASSEIISNLIDFGAITYEHWQHYDREGYAYGDTINILDDAIKAGLYDLAETIADIHIKKVFKCEYCDYDTLKKYKDISPSFVDKAQKQAYKYCSKSLVHELASQGNCSAILGLKLNDNINLTDEMIEKFNSSVDLKLENINDLAVFSEKYACILSYKNLNILFDKLNKQDKEDKTVRRALFTVYSYQLEQVSTEQQAQEQIEKMKYLTIPDNSRFVFCGENKDLICTEGSFLNYLIGNKSPEVVLLAFNKLKSLVDERGVEGDLDWGYIPKGTPMIELSLNFSSLEVVEKLYSQGLIPRSSLEKQCVYESNKTRFRELIADGTYSYEALSRFNDDVAKEFLPREMYDDFKSRREVEKKDKYRAKIEKIIKDIPYLSQEDQEKILKEYGDNKEVVKNLFISGVSIPKQKLEKMFTSEEFADIRMSEKNKQDYNMNQETSKKLEDKQKWLEEKQKLFEEKMEKYEQGEASSVNANEDIANMTDEQRKANFDAKHKLMKEHPIMLEACLSSMCMSYHMTEDKKAKLQMLADLYSIRKGWKTNKDKREMAKAFQRVLERTPSLKENENLVALSKIDVPLHQPTKSVKKQVAR